MHRPVRGAALAVSALALVAVAATACGTNNGSSKASASTSSTTSGGSGSSSASGTIALLLPENDTTRYESADHPDFAAALKTACPNCTLSYANAANSASTQLQQAQAALTKGAKVLVLDPVDGTVAGNIVSLAKQQNVPVISYDRLITGGGALPQYYISFDNVEVGKLQATALQTALQGRTGKIIWINGSPTDNNATLFKQGAHSVIPTTGTSANPIGYEIATPNWTPSVAQQEAAAAITKIGKDNIAGIYSANDGMAAGIFAAEKAAGITNFPPMTGQDAQVDGIQRILLGEQYMTVYKAVKPEATIAAQLAVALLQGQTPATLGGISQTQTADGSTQVPSYLLTPVAVTKDNIKSTVVADGWLTTAQICTSAYASACSAAGLS